MMSEKKWFAIYTKSRCEKKVVERLKHFGIEAYCPLQTTVRQWSDRKKKVQVPVLPSYVFVLVDESGKNIVRQEPSVVNFVYYLGKPAVISAKEMDLFRNFIENNSGCDFEVTSFKQGDKVLINKDGIENKDGTVLYSNDKVVAVELNNLGLSIKLVLNKNLVTKL